MRSFAKIKPSRKYSNLQCSLMIWKSNPRENIRLKIRAISRVFYFHETSHMRSFAKIKPSRKYSNLQCSLMIWKSNPRENIRLKIRAISRVFYFHETSHVRSFAKIKLSRKFSNCTVFTDDYKVFSVFFRISFLFHGTFQQVRRFNATITRTQT